jgi:phosphoribosylglycinamide formyltransferase 1
VSRKRVAVLISGGGSNMLALARDMREDDHPAELALVLSNRTIAEGVSRAAELGIPTAVVNHVAYLDRAAFEAEISAAIEAAEIDIVALAGFMRVLTPAFIDRWLGRIVNIHPSILPLFPGLHTHARALAAGMAVHGCTVHEVTPEVDAGPILGQAVTAVAPGDTAEKLAARILRLEHRLYPAVLRRFAAGDRTPLAILE